MDNLYLHFAHPSALFLLSFVLFYLHLHCLLSAPFIAATVNFI